MSESDRTPGPDVPQDDAPVGGPAGEGEAHAEAEDVAALRARAAQADALEEKLQRVKAEFLNETKRIRRLSDEESKYAIDRVVVDLLPVLDALHSARGGLGDSEAELRMAEGLDLIGQQLTKVLDSHGVEEIEAEGAPFDPNVHEAMTTLEVPGGEPNSVAEVMRPGYTLHGRVVRPTQVIVVKAPATAPQEDA